MDPVLTICIPTFNRRRLLQQTLETLLPTLTEQAEVWVLDNGSTDETWEYLVSLGNLVKRVCRETDIGADRNIMACLAAGQGKYVWILSDDDLPCSNSVKAILQAIEAFREPAFLFLRTDWQDEKLSKYSTAPVQTGWTEVDRNGYVREVGVYCTAVSSI